MQEASFQLGESSFVHRKSGICLQTRTAIQVEFKDARQASLTNSRRLLLPSHSWFPRARSLRLSLVLAFADDVDLTSIVGSDVRGVVAKHLESADVSLPSLCLADPDDPSYGKSFGTRSL